MHQGRRAIDAADDLPLPAWIGHSGMAMRHYQLGHFDAARLELQQAHDLSENTRKNGLGKLDWRDWLCGDVLLREATKLLATPEQPKAPQTR